MTTTISTRPASAGAVQRPAGGPSGGSKASATAGRHPEAKAAPGAEGARTAPEAGKAARPVEAQVRTEPPRARRAGQAGANVSKRSSGVRGGAGVSQLGVDFSALIAAALSATETPGGASSSAAKPSAAPRPGAGGQGVASAAVTIDGKSQGKAVAAAAAESAPGPAGPAAGGAGVAAARAANPQPPATAEAQQVPQADADATPKTATKGKTIAIPAEVLREAGRPAGEAQAPTPAGRAAAAAAGTKAAGAKPPHAQVTADDAGPARAGRPSAPAGPEAGVKSPTSPPDAVGRTPTPPDGRPRPNVIAPPQAAAAERPTGASRVRFSASREVPPTGEAQPTASSRPKLSPAARQALGEALGPKAPAAQRASAGQAGAAARTGFDAAVQQVAAGGANGADAAAPGVGPTASSPQTPGGVTGPGSAGAAQPADEAVTDQIAAQLRSALGRGRREVVIRLNPPELGTVRLRLQTDGNALRGELKVAHPETLDQIRLEAPGLFRQLADGGLQVRRLDISLDEQGVPEQQQQQQQWSDGAGREPSRQDADGPPDRPRAGDLPLGAPTPTPSRPTHAAAAWTGEGSVNLWV